jgi:hypothetical protein
VSKAKWRMGLASAVATVAVSALGVPGSEAGSSTTSISAQPSAGQCYLSAASASVVAGSAMAPGVETADGHGCLYSTSNQQSGDIYQGLLITKVSLAETCSSAVGVTVHEAVNGCVDAISKVYSPIPNVIIVAGGRGVLQLEVVGGDSPLTFDQQIGNLVAAGKAIAEVRKTGAASSARGAESKGSSEPGHQLVTEPIPATLSMVPAPATTEGPEGIPIPSGPALATLKSEANGSTVDGIKCQAGEQTVTHVHTHLTVFVNGQARVIPYGVGIPGFQAVSTPEGPFVETGSCFYWLHTHANDGILHVESPSTTETFTLGQFFAEWGIPPSSTQIGSVSGKQTVFFTAPGQTASIYEGVTSRSRSMWERRLWLQ